MARRKSEAGFTLVEILIVMAIIGFVMAAVLGIFQVTQQTSLFATAGEDAQLQARAVLDRLSVDLRLINLGRPTAAGAITAASSTSMTFLGDIDSDTVSAGVDATLTAAANPGDTTVQVSSSTGFSVGELLSIADGPISETIPITAVAGNTLTLGANTCGGTGLCTSYPVGSIVRSVETVSYAWDSATGNLCRNTGAACTAPFPSNQVIATGVTAFELTYYDGSIPPVQITNPPANLAGIREIRIRITIQSTSGGQIVSRVMPVSVRPRNLF